MRSVAPATVSAHPFASRDFVGGDAALDFVNTITGRDEAPRDWIASYPGLVEWAGLANLLPPDVLQTLAAEAERRPDEAAAALVRAKALREALFSVLTDMIAGEAAQPDDLALVRRHWLAGVAAHDLRSAGGRVVRQLDEAAVDLDLIAAIVAYRAVEHVLPTPPARLGMCSGPNCAWLFIDTSKAGRRRWCDMAVCGNTAKSRRFQARRAAGAT